MNKNYYIILLIAIVYSVLNINAYIGELKILKNWKSFQLIHGSYVDPADNLYKALYLFKDKKDICKEYKIYFNNKDQIGLNTHWIASFSLYPLSYNIIENFPSKIEDSVCFISELENSSKFRLISKHFIYGLYISN